MTGYLYLALGIIIVISEFMRHKKTFIDYMSMFNIYFVAYYIVPGAVNNLCADYVSRYVNYTQGMKGTFYAFFLVALSYFAVHIGYSYALKIGRIQTWTRDKYEKALVNENSFVDILISTLIVIGVLSLIGYSMMYGGIRNTLINSALIRDNAYEATSGSGSLEFISRFIICLQYAAYLIYAKYLMGKTNKVAVFIGFLLGAVYLIIHAGRAAILTFILVIIFTNYQLAEKKVKLRSWIFMIFVVSIGIIYLRPLLVSLSSLNQGFDVFVSEFVRRATSSSAPSGLKESLFKVVYNLEHKYVSLETAIRAINDGAYHFDFFRDIFAAAVAIFPSAILPFTKPDSINYYNTVLITGSTITGKIPPGGVAFGYYALGVLGVILFSLFVGVVGKRAEIFYDSYDSVCMKVLKTVYMFIWVDLFINGELKEWTLRYFVFICIMIVIFINTSKRSKNVAQNRETI